MHKQKTMDIRQKIVAASTGLGWQVPHAAYAYEMDITNVLAILQKLNNDNGSAGITLNTMLIYIITNGIKSCPIVNSHIHYNKWLASGHLETIDTIDINMPVILPSGKMFTLKLSDFGNKSLSEMQTRINQLIEKTTTTEMDIPLLKTGLHNTFLQLKHGDIIHPIGRLLGMGFGRDRLKKPAANSKRAYKSMSVHERINVSDINMGSVTISNLGSLVKNTRGFPALIDIITPQIFAVGIGPISDRYEPYYNDSKLEIRFKKDITLLLVFDHRALDFGDIIPLIKRIEEISHNPAMFF
jgi:pyruvate dehydrogenase E2 component (dihydrolipoamide acetyltransferase)